MKNTIAKLSRGLLLLATLAVFTAATSNAATITIVNNQALANKLFGSDLSAANPDINATFNLSIDTGCFGPGQVWYYGTDGLEGTNIELLPVVLHEIGHGLGFQTFTSGSSGAYNGGFPSMYDHFLFDTVN